MSWSSFDGRNPFLTPLFDGTDPAESEGRLLADTAAYYTGDGAQTDAPTVLSERDELVSGDPNGLRWQQTARGYEGYDEAGALRMLLGQYESLPAILMFGPAGETDLQRLLTAEIDTWYQGGVATIQGTESGITITDPNAPAVYAQIEAGKVSTFDTTGRSLHRGREEMLYDAGGVLIYYREADGTAHYSLSSGIETLRLGADGSITVANSSNVQQYNRTATGDVTSVGAITHRGTAYIKPVKAAVVGPAAAVSAGNAWTDVVTVSITTTETCDIDASGMLYGTLTLGATRNPAWGWRVQLDTAAPAYNAPRQSGSTGQVVSGVVAVRFASVAAGSHTLKLQAQTFTAGDTVAVGINSAELHVVAMLS